MLYSEANSRKILTMCTSQYAPSLSFLPVQLSSTTNNQFLKIIAFGETTVQRLFPQNENCHFSFIGNKYYYM